MHSFAIFYYITLLSPAMLDLHGQHGTPSRNAHKQLQLMILASWSLSLSFHVQCFYSQAIICLELPHIEPCIAVIIWFRGTSSMFAHEQAWFNKAIALRS